MSHITRKELKKDEFASEVAKTYEFVQQQRARLVRVGIAAGVVILTALGAYFFIQSRQSRSAEQLAHAIRVFHTPLVGEGPADEDVKFTDPSQRYQQAEKEFAAIADRYSWLRNGRLARYYLGLSRKHLGKGAEAMRDLREVASKGDESLASLAKLALAEVHADTGQLAEAEKLYRELADRPTDTVSKEMALLALADRLSTSKPAEAEKIYQELKKQTASKTAGEVADLRLAELKKKK